jgi:hypothetical protein
MFYFVFLLLVCVLVSTLIKRHLEHKYEEWPTDKTF